jgi:hypothetical protein
VNQKVFFITPPFTQLNTPYPATAYLKGFLNTKNIESHQADLGIEVILRLFSKEGLGQLFGEMETLEGEFSENAIRIIHLQKYYLQTIDEVISFLQDKNPTLAHVICERSYLPEASRFKELDDMDWAFGTMGIRDKARHLATLYLEDLSDLIKEVIDPHFGFSRYAEQLGLAMFSFDDMHVELQKENTLVNQILVDLLEEKIKLYQPDVLCLSIPFPGNLFSGLKCGQYIKHHYPNIKVVMGGGFANTELRSLAEERVFEYVDFITLDDGEAPFLHLLEHIEGQRDISQLKRTFTLTNGVVCYYNGTVEKDISQREAGTPDYADLPLKQYLSVIEIVNPMHRLWSDGRWNKLTLAHGCYWGKCTFCDISLDYIKNYEPITADILCDRIETIIKQTGEHGFHFVDEAAPPKLLRDLAIEILRRGITISWWTNIRFEKNFTADLCQLLKASGCIAVSGGLEVASDRLLEMIQKGVTVAQVAKVADNFTQAGIMVHAYLMYGFPTMTALETVNSLEMVRQLFENGVIQSGFWHRFCMTAHSPVGLNPEAFGVHRIDKETKRFANNDLQHSDPEGCDHGFFGEGLRKSLFNYMHGICFEFDLQEWFDFDIPTTTIAPQFIEYSIASQLEKAIIPRAKVVWLGNAPTIGFYNKKKKGKETEMAELVFHNKTEDLSIRTDADTGEWLAEMLTELMPDSNNSFTIQILQDNFEQKEMGDFEDFLKSSVWGQLRKNGLLVL